MLKWLLVIAIVVVVVLLMQRAARRALPVERPVETKVEDMVRCHVCGVNLPRSEAILSRGRFYCGEAHCRQSED